MARIPSTAISRDCASPPPPRRCDPACWRSLHPSTPRSQEVKAVLREVDVGDGGNGEDLNEATC